MASNDSMIRIRRATVERIVAKKIVRNETQDEVINRALDAMERLEAIRALDELKVAIQ